MRPAPNNWIERFGNCWSGFDCKWSNVGAWCLLGYPMAFVSSFLCAVGLHASKETFRGRGEVCVDCMHQFHK